MGGFRRRYTEWFIHSINHSAHKCCNIITLLSKYLPQYTFPKCFQARFQPGLASKYCQRVLQVVMAAYISGIMYLAGFVVLRQTTRSLWRLVFVVSAVLRSFPSFYDRSQDFSISLLTIIPLFTFSVLKNPLR